MVVEQHGCERLTHVPFAMIVASASASDLFAQQVDPIDFGSDRAGHHHWAEHTQHGADGHAFAAGLRLRRRIDGRQRHRHPTAHQ
jgi:hypothetical protein